MKLNVADTEVEDVVDGGEEVEDEGGVGEVEETQKGVLRVTAGGSDDEDADEDAGEGDETPLILGKFRTHEDLAKAYAELEKKQGGKATEDKGLRLTDKVLPAATPAAEVESLDLEGITSEFMENGSLADETYTKLEAKGLPKGTVDRYIRGLQAEAAQVRSRIADVVGGEAALPVVLEWARANLTAPEKALFDNAVQSGNEAMATLAMRGIFAQYTADSGKEAQLLGEESTPQAKGGVKPFGSMDEMVKAINDPRYRDDDKYRRSVERRIEQSQF